MPPLPDVPVTPDGLVYGSRVDIILTRQNMISVGEYKPLPYELRGEKFMLHVDNVLLIRFMLSGCTSHMHVIRTFTPQLDCMALSVSKGPGQEKVFEIFASGNQIEDSDSEDCDFDECQISEILLRLHRDYCPAFYDWFEVDPTESCFLFGDDEEYFFRKDGADGTASISSRGCGARWFEEAAEGFLQFILWILDADERYHHRLTPSRLNESG